MTRALLVLAIVLLALAAGQPATATTPGTVFEGAGGCGVCRYYGDYGFSPVNQNIPYNACASVLGPWSNSVACSGWSYWDRTRVQKGSGGHIRVGYWYRADSVPTMAYRIYGPNWNGLTITVDRLEVENVPTYNVSMCAYDFTYGGPQSSVLCEGIDW